MGTIIEMPKLSDTMTAGKLISWLVKEGDSVESGDAIAELESDKATMEFQIFDPGVIKKLYGQPGDDIVVGKPLAILGEDADDDVAELLTQAEKALADGGAKAAAPAAPAPAPAAAAAPAPSPAPSPASSPAPVAVAAAPASGGGRLRASGIAKKMAADYGLDLSLIQGSGPNGRVIKADVERAKATGTGRPAAAASAPGAPPAKKGPEPRAAQIGGGALGAAAQPATQAGHTDHALSQMRSVIARRLLESKTTIPHFQVTMDIDMEAAEAQRAGLKALGYRVSLNDFVVKATALAITKFPMVNASFQGDKIRAYNQIDIGIAVAIDDGLVVPVVRQANLKGLSTISAEVRDLATRARDRKLRPDEMSGATFSISNLGMFGVAQFNAIINPPEASILAVGGVQDRPVVRDGAVVPGRVMSVTISADHRVIDGAMAAEFLQELKALLENPLTLAL